MYIVYSLKQKRCVNHNVKNEHFLDQNRYIATCNGIRSRTI